MLAKSNQGKVARKTSADGLAQTLHLVGQEMSHVVESLVRAGAAESVSAHLSKAASGLEQLALRLGTANPTATVPAHERMQWLAALQEIARRATQAERLLASSAAFYTSWFSAPPIAADGYTAEGCWAAAQGSGGLSLKA